MKCENNINDSNIINSISINIPLDIKERINKINNQERNETEINEIINHINNTGGFIFDCNPNDCIFNINKCVINKCWCW